MKKIVGNFIIEENSSTVLSNGIIVAVPSPTDPKCRVFVHDGVTPGGLSLGPLSSSTKTDNYLATTSDYAVLMDCTSSALTLSLPAASSAKNLLLNIVKIDASSHPCNVQANGTDLINGSNTQILNVQWVSITILSNGTFWVIL